MIKIFFFLLSLICVFISQPVEAQDEPQILSSNNWSYFSNETGWTVSSYSGDKINLEIPAEINDIPVTQLGAELFMNNSNLESIQIPDSVTTIGKNAFLGCTALKEVKIPEQFVKDGVDTTMRMFWEPFPMPILSEMDGKNELMKMIPQ